MKKYIYIYIYIWIIQLSNYFEEFALFIQHSVSQIGLIIRDSCDGMVDLWINSLLLYVLLFGRFNCNSSWLQKMHVLGDFYGLFRFFQFDSSHLSLCLHLFIISFLVLRSMSLFLKVAIIVFSVRHRSHFSLCGL